MALNSHRDACGTNVEQERIPLLAKLAKEGWPRHQEDDAEGHQSWRGRGGQSSKRVWNAFRNISSEMTTPSAALWWASPAASHRRYSDRRRHSDHHGWQDCRSYWEGPAIRTAEFPRRGSTLLSRDGSSFRRAGLRIPGGII